MAVRAAITCIFVLFCMNSFVSVTASRCNTPTTASPHGCRHCVSTACNITKGMFAEFGSTRYLLGLDGACWSDARQKCHQCGYHLVRIESQREQNFIQGWLTEVVQGELGKDQNGNPQIWMDGTDQRMEGCWVWTDPTIEPFSGCFSSWGPGLPDNSYSGTEDCAALFGGFNWRWNDYLCSERLIYLCESSDGLAGPLPDLGDIDAITC